MAGKRFPGLSYLRTVVIETVLTVLGVETSNGARCTASTGVSISSKARPISREVMTLTSLVVSCTAANDYGGTKLVDLPTGNVIFLGAVCDLTVTVSGFATNTLAATNFGVGTATASNATLSGAMQDVIPVTAGTGAGATGTVKLNSGILEIGEVGIPGAKALYMNVAAPVTAGTATATISGTIEVFYLETGAPS